MFRVEFVKSGFKHGFEYRKTLESAIKVASSKGFNEGGGCWDSTPNHSLICEKQDDGGWLLVARVNKDGCHVVPAEEREDYRHLESRIEVLRKLQKRIEQDVAFAKVVSNVHKGKV